MDHTGRTRTERSFLGKVQVVFFGFTHCPDVCPTGLGYVSAALDALDRPAALDVDVVLVAAGAQAAALHPALDGLVRPVKGEILRLRHRPGALPPPSRTVRAVVSSASVVSAASRCSAVPRRAISRSR